MNMYFHEFFSKSASNSGFLHFETDMIFIQSPTLVFQLQFQSPWWWENIALAHQDKVDRVTGTRTTQTCVFDRWFGHWVQTQLDCRALRRFDFCKAFPYSRILVACKNSLLKKGLVHMKREFPSVSFLRQKMFAPTRYTFRKERHSCHAPDLFIVQLDAKLMAVPFHLYV